MQRVLGVAVLVGLGAVTIEAAGASGKGAARVTSTAAKGAATKPSPGADSRSTPAVSAANEKARKAAAGKSTPAPPRQPRGPDANTQVPADLRALGPLSIGHPHSGYLLNAAEMPRSKRWVLTVPSHGYGTQETVDQLQHCLNRVHDEFPGSHPVMLGSLSARFGGLLPPHKSHRTGRDADVYFFRQPGAQWSRAATKEDIDLPRTWALLRCFVTDTDVEMILIVRRVQDWLEEYALSKGESKEWLRSLFHDEGQAKTAIVRDVPGHVAHMHVRFVSPVARRKAVRAYDRLVSAGVVQLAGQRDKHVVVKGDTLSQLAERYDTSVAELQKLNGLSGTLIKIGQKLQVDRPIELRGARDGVYVPARRRPPPADDEVRVASAEPKRSASSEPKPGRKKRTARPPVVEVRSKRTSPKKSRASWAATRTEDSPPPAPERPKQHLKDPFAEVERDPSASRDLR